MIARAVHEWSDRRNRSFVKLIAAAIPATLLEDELFGHERVAFTGAIAKRSAVLNLRTRARYSGRGGRDPLELQSKLLRAVQEQEFERLGSNRRLESTYVSLRRQIGS